MSLLKTELSRLTMRQHNRFHEHDTFINFSLATVEIDSTFKTALNVANKLYLLDHFQITPNSQLQGQTISSLLADWDVWLARLDQLVIFMTEGTLVIEPLRPGTYRTSMTVHFPNKLAIELDDCHHSSEERLAATQ